MKLIACDVCGKIMRPSESSSVNFHNGDGKNAWIFIKESNGTYEYISDEIEKDVCRTCALKMLKIICPKFVFPDESEYEEIRKMR